MTTGRIPSVDGGIQPTIIDAAGDLIYGASNDTPARLAIGTAGQVLTVNSGATAPQWGTVAADSMTVIASGTLSGAQVDLTSIPGTYKDLHLVIRNFLPNTDAALLIVRFNNDSNTRYGAKASSTATAVNTFNASSFTLQSGNDNAVASGLVHATIYDYANTTTWKMTQVRSIATDSTTTTSYSARDLLGFYNQTGAITQINLFPDSGNFTSGSYILYGVK